MIKQKKCILLCFTVVANILLSNHSLKSQTKTVSPPDTSKRSVQKPKPKEDQPKLELPDVLIYGIDRAVRVTGEKKESFQKDIKLIAPTVTYQPLTSELNLKSQKSYFQARRQAKESRTKIQLDGGRYQQFDAIFGHWKEAEGYNYILEANYGRSNGQYQNSQYTQGLVKGQIGVNLTQQFVLTSQGNYQLLDYGLYGAQLENLKRKIDGGSAKVDALLSSSVDQSTELSLDLQQKKYKDDVADSTKAELKERNIGLLGTFKTELGSTPLFLRASYDYHKLNYQDSTATNSQKYLLAKMWLAFVLKQRVIIKPGFQIENLKISDAFSKNKISPYLEIIAMPSTSLGLLLRGSRGYAPVSYTERWEENPYLSHQVNFIPTEKEIDLKFEIDFHPSSKVTLIGDVKREDWKNYPYWYYEPAIGNFQLAPLEKLTLIIGSFEGKLHFSEKISFNAGVQIAFDSIKDDSLTSQTANLPYLEKLKFPLKFEYQISKNTKSELNFVWIGPRYFKLTSDEKLSKHGLLSLQVENQFQDHIGFYVKGNNLLDQNYELWEKYPGMGLYFELGLRGSW